MNNSSIPLHSSKATKNDPTVPIPSRSKQLDRIPLGRSTQQVREPCKSVPSAHTNVSFPLANVPKQGQFDAMKIVMSLLIALALTGMYIAANHVHRQLVLVNRDQFEKTGMNTTVNVVDHFDMDVKDVKMDQNVMNDEILDSFASSILKFKAPTELSTEQKLTNFDLGIFVEAETAGVDGKRKTSTEKTGARAVSSDLYLIF